MKHLACALLMAFAAVCDAHGQPVTRDIPYGSAHERQVLDVYAPAGAKNLPVVFARSPRTAATRCECW